MTGKTERKIRLSDSDYMVKKRSEQVRSKFSKQYAKGRLLDIGCGTKPKREFYEDTVSEHIGLDYPDSPHGLENVDVIATAYDTRQPDCSFDTVLCTAVIEHLEEPERALKESYRVLKNGGHAIYTAPLFWHLHEEPRDFYRFTAHGLRYLFEKAGFEILELHPCGGFWVTFGSEFNYYISSFAKGPVKYPINALKCLNNILCLCLDRIHRAEKFTWMYLVVARKP